MKIKRKKTRKIWVGSVAIGGDAPISVQSMTKSHPEDVENIIKEVEELKREGCDIVRMGIPNERALEALKEVKKRVNIPIVADIHFDYRLAIKAVEAGADCVRINPSNIGENWKVREVVKACKDKGIPIRVGVNAGSVDRKKYPKVSPDLLVQIAMEEIKVLEDLDFRDIKVSIKSSDVKMMIEANRKISGLVDYPLHIGVTEAGPPPLGIVKNSIGIGTLLLEGIGDTIRVSLSAPSVEEVRIGKEILRSVGYQVEGIEIISCPTCARAEVDIIRIVREFREKAMERGIWNKYKGLKVAIMGCVVNGPGEAHDAHIGIACGKTKSILFKNGIIIRYIDNDKIIEELLKELEENAKSENFVGDK